MDTPLGRCKEKLKTMFGDLTPMFTVTTSAPSSDTPPFFVVSDIPYVYLRLLYNFCSTHGVYATVNMGENSKIKEIVFQESPPKTPPSNYEGAEACVECLLEAESDASPDLRNILVNIAATLYNTHKLPSPHFRLVTRTFDYYIEAELASINTVQLHTIFTSTRVREGTIQPLSTNGVSFRITNTPTATKMSAGARIRQRGDRPGGKWRMESQGKVGETAFSPPSPPPPTAPHRGPTAKFSPYLRPTGQQMDVKTIFRERGASVEIVEDGPR